MAEGYTFRSSQSFINCSLENVDINSIKMLNSQLHLVYDGRRIRWTKDFCSLKEFIKDVVGLSGKWKSPSGGAKQFEGFDCDFVMTWYPGKDIIAIATVDVAWSLRSWRALS